MPFTRISLLKGKSPDYLRAVSDALHTALVETLDVPADDRFQAIHQHEKTELIFDAHYMGGPRNDDFILFQITAGKERNEQTKNNFYHRLAELLARDPGVAPENVMVIIQMTSVTDWSFSGGQPLSAMMNRQ